MNKSINGPATLVNFYRTRWSNYQAYASKYHNFKYSTAHFNFPNYKTDKEFHFSALSMFSYHFIIKFPIFLATNQHCSKNYSTLNRKYCISMNAVKSLFLKSITKCHKYLFLILQDLTKERNPSSAKLSMIWNIS